MFLYRPTRSLTGRRITKVGRNYIKMLAFILAGYAVIGKGFAYLGIAPLYIGELTLLLGIWALFNSGQAGRMLKLSYFLPLLMFMCWGFFRTVPYLGIYGIDTVRDAVVWGYGLFAIVTAGVLVAVPERLALLVKHFKRYAVVYLMVMPVLWGVDRIFDGFWPINPITGVGYLEYKGGDVCVQLAGIFAFLSTLGAGGNPWVAPILIPLNLALNLEGRAGLVTFCLGTSIVIALKPINQRAWRVLSVILVCLTLLWATGFEMQAPGGRKISFDYLMQTITSIFSDKHTDPLLEGSKEWRKKWWTQIVNYTVHGKYFWTGKGFGINLAKDDGFLVDPTLRSPHNGHLTMLARAGVPGFLLWAFTQLSFGFWMLKNYLRARRKADYKWAGLFLVLLVYWAGLLTNASFDVFIEGPMGGIWLWSIYGIGIASILIFRKSPQVLYLPDYAIEI
jgi:hypothetical protein